MIYAGLDLHKNFSVITMMDSQGREVIKQKRLSNNSEIIELFRGLNKPIAVAVKYTRGWFFICL